MFLGNKKCRIYAVLWRFANAYSLIIYVRGTRLALGKHITSGIEVEEVEEDAER